MATKTATANGLHDLAQIVWNHCQTSPDNLTIDQAKNFQEVGLFLNVTIKVEPANNPSEGLIVLSKLDDIEKRITDIGKSRSSLNWRFLVSGKQGKFFVFGA